MAFSEEMERNIKNLENMISEEKKKIDLFCMEIGSLYYEQNKYKTNPLFANQIAGIRMSLVRIEGYNNQINFIKNTAVETNPDKVCDICGKALRAEDRFCSCCGNKVEAKAPVFAGEVCQNCGTPLRSGDIFCMVCGTKAELADTAPLYPPEAKVVFSMAAPPRAQVVYQAPAVTEIPAEDEAVKDAVAEDAAPETVTEAVAEEFVLQEEPASEIEETAEENASEDVPKAELTAEEESEAETASEIIVPEEVSQEPAAEVAETVEAPEVEIAEISAEEVAAPTICEVPVQTPPVTGASEFSNPYETMAESRLCSVCSREVSPTAKYCIYCGTKL